MEKKDRKDANGMRHLGTLVKIANGRTYKPETPGVKGNFYLMVSEDGRRRKIRLLDENGKPICSLKAAQAAQLKLRAAFVTDDRIAAIRASMGEVSHLEEQRKAEDEAANPPLRIDGAWEKWLEVSDVRCGAGSLKNYGAYWRGFVDFCRKSGKMAGKGLYLRDIPQELARARVSHLETAGASAGTVNKHVMFLRSFFEALKEPGRLTCNPWDGIKARKVIPNSRRVLTLEELRAVMDAAQGEMHTLFLLGIATGMRLEDCCLLKWEEVDMAAGVIRHRPFKTLHSSGAAVTLGIPAELREELEGLRGGLGERGQGAGYVLPDTAQNYLDGPNGRTRVCTRCQRLFRRCGIQTTKTTDASGREVDPETFQGRKKTITLVGFHSLRHTWVSLQAMAGTPFAVIQASAGHSSPAMTEHYTHVNERAAIQAAGVIEATFRRVDEEDGDGVEELRREALEAVGKADAETLRRVLEVLRG